MNSSVQTQLLGVQSSLHIMGICVAVGVADGAEGVVATESLGGLAEPPGVLGGLVVLGGLAGRLSVRGSRGRALVGSLYSRSNE